MQKFTTQIKTLVISLLVLLLGSVVSVLLFAFFDYSPANADSITSDLEVKVNEVLGLSLENCDSSNSSVVSVSLTPSSAGTFKSACQTAIVDTNNPGYSLTAKSSSSDLLYQNPTTVTPAPVIPSTSATTTTPAVLSNDVWGFAAEDRLNFESSYTENNASNTFAALPTTDTEIYSTDVWPLDETSHTFFYATKLTPDTMAGTYMTTITYTAIGEEVPERISYPLVKNGAFFQDTTYDINQSCSSLPIYNKDNPDPASTVIMTDSRNNQQYRVRRLQDGKCWMIDNLKLATPGTALTLTSNDTNISSGTTFTIPANAITTSTNRATNGTCVDGEASGTAGNLTCNGTTTQSEANNKFIAYVDPSNTTECLNNTATNGDTNAYNTDSQTQCGYLYNWYTATAGTGTYSLASGNDATSSICPIGWRLPSAGTGTANTNNEFAVLNGAMINTSSSILNDDTTRPNWRPSGPFSGTYAGYWATGFNSQGNDGYYWSASAYSTTYARILYFYYGTVYPGNTTYDKYYGSSVRCVL